MFTVKSPPKCPVLTFLSHYPLNTSQPTNLAGSQKLLSVGGDIEFPVIAGHLGLDWSDGVEVCSSFNKFLPKDIFLGFVD